jgi:hypothetical protein
MGQSDYLYKAASIWLPAYERVCLSVCLSVYLITCTRMGQSDYLYKTASTWLPAYERVCLSICLCVCLSV